MKLESSLGTWVRCGNVILEVLGQKITVRVDGRSNKKKNHELSTAQEGDRSRNKTYDN